jgi:hypothetical protein
MDTRTDMDSVEKEKVPSPNGSLTSVVQPVRLTILVEEEHMYNY